MRCSVIQERLAQSILSVKFSTGKAFLQQSTTCVRSAQHAKEQKTTNQKYGNLSPKQAETNPWDMVCVDLIVPETIHRKVQKTA